MFLRSKQRAVSLDAPRCIGSCSTLHREKPPAASSQVAFCVGNYCQAFSHRYQPAFLLPPSCLYCSLVLPFSFPCSAFLLPPSCLYCSLVLYVALQRNPRPSCLLGFAGFVCCVANATHGTTAKIQLFRQRWGINEKKCLPLHIIYDMSPTKPKAEQQGLV